MQQHNVLVLGIRQLEETTALDPPVRAGEPSMTPLFAPGTCGSVLRGDWLGHALHSCSPTCHRSLDLRDARVGLVHAATNAVAIGTYTASYVARRQAGTGPVLMGSTVSGVGTSAGTWPRLAR